MRRFVHFGGAAGPGRIGKRLPGTQGGMTEKDEHLDPADSDRITSRSDLLPEEQAAGSDDPRHQAEAILEESDERTDDPEQTGAASTQTSTPDERPDRS